LADGQCPPGGRGPNGGEGGDQKLIVSGYNDVGRGKVVRERETRSSWGDSLHEALRRSASASPKFVYRHARRPQAREKKERRSQGGRGERAALEEGLAQKKKGTSHILSGCQEKRENLLIFCFAIVKEEKGEART